MMVTGDFGKYVLEERLKLYGGVPDVLGAAMSESVLSMFLRYDATDDEFSVTASLLPRSRARHLSLLRVGP